MMTEAGGLEPTDDTFREYERVVDAKYLEQIRAEAKEFSTKRLSRQSRLAECAIRSFKSGKNTIRPRSLRKLVRAIHDLQNKKCEELKTASFLARFDKNTGWPQPTIEVRSGRSWVNE